MGGITCETQQSTAETIDRMFRVFRVAEKGPFDRSNLNAIAQPGSNRFLEPRSVDGLDLGHHLLVGWV